MYGIYVVKCPTASDPDNFEKKILLSFGPQKVHFEVQEKESPCHAQVYQFLMRAL